MRHPPEGLVLLDKPQGPTSHDVVDGIRKLTGQRRVGHAGTLDPMATGLLPVVLGRATRLVRFLPSAPKTYSGTIRLGVTTETDDVTGQTLSRHSGPAPNRESVLGAARSLQESRSQVPPAISAKRIAGERAYRLARQGVAVAPAPFPVTVSRLEILETEDRWVWSFVAEVSAGTYLRALARDLGAMLGCGGALGSLRRLRIGPFEVASAIAMPRSVGDLERAILPLEAIPLSLPSLRLAGDLEVKFLRGTAVATPEASAATGPCRVLDDRGQLLGIGDAAGGLLRPSVVLAPPPP